MSKAKAIELAEKFHDLARQAIDNNDRSVYYDLAAQYYREAGQDGMSFSCERKANA